MDEITSYLENKLSPKLFLTWETLRRAVTSLEVSDTQEGRGKFDYVNKIHTNLVKINQSKI